MAATQTVYQLPQSRNSSKTLSPPQTLASEDHIWLRPQHGVVTLFGYGIAVRVDRGHLILEDGIGAARQQARFPRVGHGLRRLVVIGADGIVSLAALRWLADQDAAFVMLDRDGSVLATTGPVRPSDARLRRAQALAHQCGVGLRIARELVRQKLAGQEHIVRNKLGDTTAAETISRARDAITKADTIPAIRLLESQAAYAYWSAWHTVPINFPRIDLRRVPDHWRIFGSRMSPLSGSPRLAVNPPNAMLNYLYALLESEARLAAAALGLDPGFGVMHVDSRTRDSLACDLMEPIRPQIDAYLLDWISRQPLRREWYFEQRDGNCRLMGSFAARLSETAPTWGRAVAPLAEWVSRLLWSTIAKPARQLLPSTRLTQSRRRQAKGGPSRLPVKPAPGPTAICRICGTAIACGHRYCAACAVSVSRENLIAAAKLGRVAGHSREARARQAEAQRRHAAAKRAWQASSQPVWLDKETYVRKIQPLLSGVKVPVLAAALGISEPYAAEIRAGRYLPHPRHWQALAKLVGVLPDVQGGPNGPVREFRHN